MKIYRLQHTVSKLGVWQSFNTPGVDNGYYFSKAMKRIKHRCIFHYNVTDEFGDDKFEFFKLNNYKCACSSIQQFYEWFELDWIALQKWGFELLEIEIEENVFNGKFQVMFNEKFIIDVKVVSESEYRSML